MTKDLIERLEAATGADYRTRLARYIAGDYVAEIWPEETFGDVKPSDNVKADLRSLLSEADDKDAEITALEDGNMTFLCDQLDKAKAENERLRSLVEEAGKVVEQLADELEPEVMNSGGSPRQIKRDMEPVVRARSLLTKLKGEEQ